MLRYVFWVSVCLIVRCGIVTATESTISPSTHTVQTAGSGSHNNPQYAYDTNHATSGNHAVTKPWTQGAGTNYRQFTFSGFPSGYTPTTLRLSYNTYLNGLAGCPATFLAEYDLGDGFETWVFWQDDSSAPPIDVGPVWLEKDLAGVVGSGNIQVRVTTLAQRSPGCGFSGPAASAAIQEIEMVVNDCARPLNFVQNGAGFTDGQGGIGFNYEWDSSTGDLSDLALCTIYERLEYSPAPFSSPPFPPDFPITATSPNPNDLLLGGFSPASGVGTDGHDAPPQVPGPQFVTPYTAATGTGEQHYLFSCPCYSSALKIVMDGPYTITRSVSQNGDGSWKYTVNKNGVSNTISPLP